MEEASLSLITKTFEPAINNLVSSFIKIVKNNNSTKVALAKIDADMNTVISQIKNKGEIAGSIIQVCSDKMRDALNMSSLTFEQKTALIDKFTTAMLDTLDKF